MKKVLICVDDGLMKFRLGRIFAEQGYAYEMTGNPISLEDVRNYRLLVVHSSYRLANLSGFIANLLKSELLPVLFVSQNPGAMAALQQKDQPAFTFISEARIDSELTMAAAIHLKYQEKLKDTEAKDAKKRNREIDDKLLLMAKTLLVMRGLSETEAYKDIRKQAMDAKVSKYVIAEKILKNNS